MMNEVSLGFSGCGHRVRVRASLGALTLISHPARSAALRRNDNNIHHLTGHLYRQGRGAQCEVAAPQQRVCAAAEVCFCCKKEGRAGLEHNGLIETCFFFFFPLSVSMMCFLKVRLASGQILAALFP